MADKQSHQEQKKDLFYVSHEMLWASLAVMAIVVAALVITQAYMLIVHGF